MSMLAEKVKMKMNKWDEITISCTVHRLIDIRAGSRHETENSTDEVMAWKINLIMNRLILDEYQMKKLQKPS